MRAGCAFPRTGTPPTHTTHNPPTSPTHSKHILTLTSNPFPWVNAHTDEGLLIRPVDVRSTATTRYEDPLHVDESIVFYRVSLDPALRELTPDGESWEQAQEYANE